MALTVCPHCRKKQFNDSSRKCYACRTQLRAGDGTPVIVPDGYNLDEHGNIRSIKHSVIKDGQLHISYHFILEKGKTTLRGEFPKLEGPAKCSHPERLSCNYGEGFDRCEFMKYEHGRWDCTA